MDEMYCNKRCSECTRIDKTSCSDYRGESFNTGEKAVSADRERTEFLGKWFMIQFWILIAANVTSLLTVNKIKFFTPGINLFGQILTVAITIVYAYVFVKCGKYEEKYKKAGVFYLINEVLGLLSVLCTFELSSKGFSTFFELAGAVFAFLGTYNMCKAHIEMLKDVDWKLSGAWDNIWKWYIGVLVSLFASVLIMLINIYLGIVVLILAVVAYVVLSIVIIVYQYLTARAFKERAACNRV